MTHEGIRYVAPNDDGRRGYIEAWNVGSNSKTRAAHGAGETCFPHLRSDAPLVEKSESAGALICRNGKRYLVTAG